MALVISIEDLSRDLDTFQKKVENLVVRDMKEETPVANTGMLKSSIRVLRSVKDKLSIIGTDLSYAEHVVTGGDNTKAFPDYRGNRKSIHNPTWSDFSEPIFEKNGNRRFIRPKYTRPNPFDIRTEEALKKVDWSDVFYDEWGEYADFE